MQSRGAIVARASTPAAVSDQAAMMDVIHPSVCRDELDIVWSM
jgi:hypothetical protein